MRCYLHCAVCIVCMIISNTAQLCEVCIYIVQKGTPWECGFSLHSATTDTAHVPWFSHCFATTENFCLVFLQWLNKTKNQKNKKQKKQEKQNDKTQLSATTTPLGVCNLVFLDFWFFGFLVFWFLVFCFVLGFFCNG